MSNLTQPQIYQKCLKMRELVLRDPDNAELRLSYAIWLFAYEYSTDVLNKSFWSWLPASEDSLILQVAIWETDPVNAGKQTSQSMEDSIGSQLDLLLSRKGDQSPITTARAKFLKFWILGIENKLVFDDAVPRKFAQEIIDLCRNIETSNPDWADSQSLHKAANNLLEMVPDHRLINDGSYSQHTLLNRFHSEKAGLTLELHVEELLKRMGFSATRTKETADGGIDIDAVSSNPIVAGRYIIQCKDWSNPVGASIVRDLYGVVIAEGANKGIIITTGDFTTPARQFAKGKPIELIDGPMLNRLLLEYRIK